jgi:anti-sigma B factor antagonist
MIVNVETRELSPGISLIAFTGRLVLGRDLNDVERKVRQFIQEGASKLVLDFSGLEYIDSSGIGVLAVCAGLMDEKGGKLAAVCPDGQVKKLLKLTRLDQVMGVFEDSPSAHDSLRAPDAPPQA